MNWWEDFFGAVDPPVYYCLAAEVGRRSKLVCLDLCVNKISVGGTWLPFILSPHFSRTTRSLLGIGQVEEEEERAGYFLVNELVICVCLAVGLGRRRRAR